jgi:DNA phosphorothioation-associated putative methyltransferase
MIPAQYMSSTSASKGWSDGLVSAESLGQSRSPSVSARDEGATFAEETGASPQANNLLFQAGNADAVDDVCRRSAFGKLLPNALYVHRSVLESLEPVLRVYEGCARAYLGEIDGAIVIKLHRHSGKVSYLVYPEFDTDPHPPLLRSVKLSLRTREIECLDYAGTANPPVLHRKETFLTGDHPLYARFARLTAEEEQHGLLDDAATIGTREGWQARLSAAGFAVRGHRLVRYRS